MVTLFLDVLFHGNHRNYLHLHHRLSPYGALPFVSSAPLDTADRISNSCDDYISIHIRSLYMSTGYRSSLYHAGRYTWVSLLLRGGIHDRQQRVARCPTLRHNKTRNRFRRGDRSTGHRPRDLCILRQGPKVWNNDNDRRQQ